MTRVYLTSGPRGAGKTFLVRQIKQLYPGFHYVNRDETFIELFGSSGLSKYSGEMHHGYRVMFGRIKVYIEDSPDVDKTIILDCWNGFSKERAAIIEKLKEIGADEVYCIQFLISLEVNIDFALKKPEMENYSKNSLFWDHDLYYSQAKNIKKDGFDKVYRIDQNQPELFPMLPLRFIFSHHD